MSNEQLARMHFDMVMQMVSKETVLAWLAGGVPEPLVVPATKSNRGRRPGAASDEARCAWKYDDTNQCKNTKKDGAAHCKMHIKKLHLLDA
jgi:hypothetical protein